jgi:hypothetical protein
VVVVLLCSLEAAAPAKADGLNGQRETATISLSLSLSLMYVVAAALSPLSVSESDRPVRRPLFRRMGAAS